MQPLARRQLLPYGPGNKPLASINNDSGDYGIFGTAAVHAGLKRLFVGVGGDFIDSNSTPFVRALDWHTLADVWPTAIGADGIARYAIPDSPLYATPNETGLSSPAVVNDLIFVTTSKPGIYAFAADSGKCLWTDPGLSARSGGGWSLGVAIWQDKVLLR
jgi:hypothetical protein